MRDVLRDIVIISVMTLAMSVRSSFEFPSQSIISSRLADENRLVRNSSCRLTPFTPVGPFDVVDTITGSVQGRQFPCGMDSADAAVRCPS
jgi:hypothetical protein